MKIDNSIASYYFSQRRQQAGTITPIEESGGDARPRQTPTIAPPSTSNALSSALWMTAARDGESTASISEKQGPAASDGSVSDEFLQEAKKSLAEKIREQVLKAMGLTEGDLKEMDPEQRQAVEEEIRKAVERAMGVEEQRDAATADLASGGGVA
ncbi:hypothetical protein [Ensifer adhaerens]|uniref:hypothetical protein n=1 Tax=Ensifer adhaerens TaxID=106592 RepID=UPI000CF0A6AA|nr:hypothetical protein [Ensifer adhaerens]